MLFNSGLLFYHLVFIWTADSSVSSDTNSDLASQDWGLCSQTPASVSEFPSDTLTLTLIKWSCTTTNCIFLINIPSYLDTAHNSVLLPYSIWTPAETCLSGWQFTTGAIKLEPSSGNSNGDHLAEAGHIFLHRSWGHVKRTFWLST